MVLPAINMDISSLPYLACECGSNVFTPGFFARKVSAIMSPEGKDGILLQDAGFFCMGCKKQINLNTDQLEKSNEHPS
jgi:hypothetical protein